MNLLKKYYSMSTLEKLDKVDLQILRTLQENARLTTKELAARVSLSSTPVFERLKRLENGGYIKKYIAVLDAEKLNQGFVVFCSVKLRRLNRDIAAEFTRIIQDIPEVTECYNISGSYDYLLKIHSPNMNFQWMPELGWRYGYVFAWTLMLILVAVIYFYFKRKKWY